MKDLTAVITGGGTGGHIYPALAIAKGLKDSYDARILYVGGDNSLESRLAKEAGLEFQPVTAAAVSGRSLKAVGAIFKNIHGIKEAKKILSELEPDIVIGTGGYVEVPVVYAATSMRIPSIIHEQNAYPGLANRFLSRRVDQVCLTYEDASKNFPKSAKLALTGLPVRKEIMEKKREDAYRYFKIDGKKPVFLIVGGSQGAKAINEAVEASWQNLLDQGLELIHITGPKNYDKIKEAAEKAGLGETNGLIIMPYLNEMENALAAADLVLGRAGASFLAEVVCRGIPAVLVPYPFAAANHQYYNAMNLEKAGAAIVIENDILNAQSLQDGVIPLIKDKERLEKMAAASAGMGAPNALANIVGLVIKLVQEHK